MAKTKLKALTEFNIRVKRAREKAGLTQKELAEAIKLTGVPCTQGAIDKLENRRADSSTKTVQIAAACNVSPYWLASGVGDMTVKELPPDAMAIGAAWQHFRPQAAKDRYTHDLLGLALNFMPPGHPWYKTALKLFKESAKRHGVKEDLKQKAA